jgi:hypothetical protein
MSLYRLNQVFWIAVLLLIFAAVQGARGQSAVSVNPNTHELTRPTADELSAPNNLARAGRVDHTSDSDLTIGPGTRLVHWSVATQSTTRTLTIPDEVDVPGGHEIIISIDDVNSESVEVADSGGVIDTLTGGTPYNRVYINESGAWTVEPIGTVRTRDTGTASANVPTISDADARYVRKTESPLAIGSGAVAGGSYASAAIALGANAYSNSSSFGPAIVIGPNSQGGQQGGISIGGICGGQNTGTFGGLAFGGSTYSLGQSAYAFGQNNLAFGFAAHAGGTWTHNWAVTANGTASVTISGDVTSTFTPGALFALVDDTLPYTQAPRVNNEVVSSSYSSPNTTVTFTAAVNAAYTRAYPQSLATNAIQIGQGHNSTSNSIQVRNFQLMELTNGRIVAPVRGVANNSSASAGDVGEVISSTVAVGSAVSLTTDTPANVTSISLTAGDWDVSGTVYYAQGSATEALYYTAGISATTATLPGYAGTQASIPGNGAATGGAYTPSVPISPARVSLSSTTTYYLVAQSGFLADTSAAYGHLRARRMR